MVLIDQKRFDYLSDDKSTDENQVGKFSAYLNYKEK